MKSQNMIDFLDSMFHATHGRTRSECLEQNICVDCGGDATEFDGPLSEKEYSLSALCQKCQNKVFGVDSNK